MKTVIEMARSVGARPQQNKNCDVEYLMDAVALERFAELVRADERNSWPAEMEAMERQVNILTDALAEEREKWMERIAILIRGEREACAKLCDWYVDYSSNPMNFAENCAQEIRARSNT